MCRWPHRQPAHKAHRGAEFEVAQFNLSATHGGSTCTELCNEETRTLYEQIWNGHSSAGGAHGNDGMLLQDIDVGDAIIFGMCIGDNLRLFNTLHLLDIRSWFDGRHRIVARGGPKLDDRVELSLRTLPCMEEAKGSEMIGRS
jgi:hypothetical protein